MCHHLGTFSHVWHVPVKVWCVQLYYRYHTGRSCIGIYRMSTARVVFGSQVHPGQVPGTRCPVKLSKQKLYYQNTSIMYTTSSPTDFARPQGNGLVLFEKVTTVQVCIRKEG